MMAKEMIKPWKQLKDYTATLPGGKANPSDEKNKSIRKTQPFKCHRFLEEWQKKKKKSLKI